MSYNILLVVYYKGVDVHVQSVSMFFNILALTNLSNKISFVLYSDIEMSASPSQSVVLLNSCIIDANTK